MSEQMISKGFWDVVYEYPTFGLIITLSAIWATERTIKYIFLHDTTNEDHDSSDENENHTH